MPAVVAEMGQRPSAPNPLCDTPNGGRPRSRPAASVQDRPILNAGPRRTTIAPKSARSTAAYQTDASASTRTSPTRMAMGATHAAGLMSGLAALTREQWHPPHEALGRPGLGMKFLLDEPCGILL